MINLLPWRETQILKKQQIFYFMLAGLAVIACLSIFLMHIELSSRRHSQMQINQNLSKEIIDLQQQLFTLQATRQATQYLSEQIRLLKKLQYNRKKSIELYTLLGHILPPGTYLEMVARHAKQITLRGRVESNEQATRLINNLYLLLRFKDIILNEIRTDETDSSYNTKFILQLRE